MTSKSCGKEMGQVDKGQNVDYTDQILYLSPIEYWQIVLPKTCKLLPAISIMDHSTSEILIFSTLIAIESFKTILIYGKLIWYLEYDFGRKHVINSYKCIYKWLYLSVQKGMYLSREL